MYYDDLLLWQKGIFIAFENSYAHVGRGGGGYGAPGRRTCRVRRVHACPDKIHGGVVSLAGPDGAKPIILKEEQPVYPPPIHASFA